MKGFTRRVGVSLVAAVLALAALPLAGQSFGDHEQVLVIGATAFSAGPSSLDADGYSLCYGLQGCVEWAPLVLPEGAEVLQLCLFSDDRNVVSPTRAHLRATKLVQAGAGGPDDVIIPNTTIETTPGAGLASYCTGPLTDTIQSVVDLDGDGIPDPVAYYLGVELDEQGRYGGMTVTWKRQVSPPPAVPTFGDVPPSDGAFQHIEALVASGITAGCGGGNYCPGATLTRRQMAVFLAKALGLYWPN